MHISQYYKDAVKVMNIFWFKEIYATPLKTMISRPQTITSFKVYFRIFWMITKRNPNVFKYLNCKKSLIQTKAPTIASRKSNLKLVSVE